MNFVTVVNRVNEVLQGTWNGRHVDIPLGKSQFLEIEARKFKEQNPVMGSEDPRTGRMVYKIGIVEFNDPIDMIDGKARGVERWDRAKLSGAKPADVVPGDNGLYSVRQIAGNLPVDANFDKP